MPLDQSSSMNMEDIHKDALVAIAPMTFRRRNTKLSIVTFYKPRRQW